MSSARLRVLQEFSKAASDKLASSGLDEAQAQTLGMYYTANAALLDASFEAVPGIAIPYFDIKGGPLAANANWPQFYRIRYLDDRITFTDAAGKKQRYTQPPHSGVCAYLPNASPWAHIAGDVTEPIVITEGEFKAAASCLHGIPCIGLGGVYNFRQTQKGIFWLPELEAFKWSRRRVVIVYDSDYKEKPNICAAINALAEELQQRGAMVELATLPDVYEDDRKTGIDDLLVERGEEELIAVLNSSEAIGMSSTLWQMNEELVYVRDPGLIIVKDKIKMAPTAFTGHSDYATLSVPERTVRPNGSVSVEKVSGAAAWIKWPLRKFVQQITYAPGHDRYFFEGGVELVNQWKGWGCAPKKGSIEPWNQLIKFIFQGCDPGFLEWFLDWCAYPLQNPGAKMFSAVVVHGRATGTGKTLIGYILGRIYGSNFTKIENKDLKRDFNGWAENKQFILGDEISGTDKRHEADALKTVITQEELTINVKMVPTYSVPDVINYYFTSNHADAFFIEDKDRRYAIHEVLHDEPLPDSFYREVEAWKNGDGPAALFHWLLQRDVSGFNPKAAAFRTSARARMANAGKSDLGIWCSELREFPVAMLRFGKLQHQRDLFTSAELLRMYQDGNEQGLKVSSNGMARALHAAGFHQLNGGIPVMVGERQHRYFVIRNFERWKNVRNIREITKHINLPPIKVV